MGIVALELCSFLILSVRDGRVGAVGDRWEQDETNDFVRRANANAPGGCSFVDILYPHPYLGFAHNPESKCRGSKVINSQGLFGQEIPARRDPKNFYVLLVGGSVAAQIGGISNSELNFIEILLNAKYRPPHGEKFVVLNGGLGAGKQPQQAITFMMFADRVDAVVTLDGFNEHYVVGGATRIEFPSANFVTVNPAVTVSFKDVIKQWAVGKAYWFCSRSVICKYSPTAFLTLSTLRKQMAQSLPSLGESILAHFFAYPKDFTAEDKYHEGMKGYAKYTEFISVSAHSSGLLASHFIQPVPALNKNLAPEEKAIVGALDYADLYLRMNRDFLELKKRGLQVHSLIDVFKNTNEAVYSDHIHCKVNRETGESLGYRLIAEQMVREIAKDWKLQAKL